MEYRPVRIVDVIRDINRDIFLPDIQRELVWKTPGIEKLFDSIMSDYPIGSFLFWKVLNENKNKWNIYEFIRDFNEEKAHNEPIYQSSFLEPEPENSDKEFWYEVGRILDFNDSEDAKSKLSPDLA